jgi:hypothetical protein
MIFSILVDYPVQNVKLREVTAISLHNLARHEISSLHCLYEFGSA